MWINPYVFDSLRSENLRLTEENKTLEATITGLQIQHSKGLYTPLHEAERMKLRAENARLTEENTKLLLNCTDSINEFISLREENEKLKAESVAAHPFYYKEWEKQKSLCDELAEKLKDAILSLNDFQVDSSWHQKAIKKYHESKGRGEGK